jgi:hypothetical protein
MVVLNVPVSKRNARYQEVLQSHGVILNSDCRERVGGIHLSKCCEQKSAQRCRPKKLIIHTRVPVIQAILNLSVQIKPVQLLVIYWGWFWYPCTWLTSVFPLYLFLFQKTVRRYRSFGVLLFFSFLLLLYLIGSIRLLILWFLLFFLVYLEWGSFDWLFSKLLSFRGLRLNIC